MKKIKYPLLVLLSIGLSFSSCKKDDSKDEVDPDTEQNDIDNTANSTKDVATQKQDIQTAGIQLASELKTINESKSMQAIASLSSLSSQNSSFPLAPVYKSLSESQEADLIASSLKASAGEISNEFADETGIHTWNISKNDWDTEESSSIIMFKFPATKDGTTNNAELAVTDAKMVQNNLTGENMPTSIAISLKVDGTTVLSYTYVASYDANGIPKSVSTQLSIEPGIKLSANLSVSDTQITEAFSFTSSGTNILSFNVDAKGTFTQAKIEAVAEQMETATTLAPASEILSSISLSYQVLDIIISVDANTAEIANNVSTRSETLPASSVLNDNINMTISYADGTTIATSEIIIDSESKEPKIDLMFKDDSRVDAEVYFKESMTDLEAEINTFVEEINKSFAFFNDDSEEYDYGDSYYTDSL